MKTEGGIDMPRPAGVLVVGAGPTGLVLACELARRNVPFDIVERRDTPQAGSRDVELHPRSLEVLDDLGVIEQVLAGGQTGVPVRLYTDGAPTLELHANAPRELPYPESVSLPQWRLEQILRDRLAAFGAWVRFGVELSAFAHNDAGVVAGLTRRGGDAEVVDYAYLVGCDGSHSTVRRELGIRPEENPHTDRYYLVADVTVEGLPRHCGHAWMDASGEYVSVRPLPGPTDWHFEATAPYGYLPGRPLEECGALLRQRSGRADVTVRSLSWVSSYRLHTRGLDRFRYGRVLLAGDAAHTHGGPGGQGMNTGIQDAHNLGWKLAATLNGANAGLLDSYQSERSGAARLLHDGAADLDGLSRRHRPIATLARHPAVARRLLAVTAELAVAYPDSPLTRTGDRQPGDRQPGDRRGGDRRGGARRGGARPGERAPDVACTHPGGAPARLRDALRGPHWTLLGFGPDAWPALNAVKAATATVHCWQITRSARDGGDLVSPQAYQAFRARPGTLVLIRPDGHLALRTRQVADVIGYLAWLYPRGERLGESRPALHRWRPRQARPLAARIQE